MKISTMTASDVIKTFILFALLVSAGCNKNKEIPNQQKVDGQVYTTTYPKRVNYANKISATGTLSNKNEFQLSFMVGGIINFLDANEGDYVKKGQVLARINQTSVNVLTERLTLAYEKDKRDYERVEALYKDDVVTLENLQNAKTGLENTRLQLENAKFSQEHATIKAPCSGRIQSVLVEENEMIQAGTPSIIMGSDKSGKVLKTNLADVDIVKVNLKDSCFIQFDAYPDVVFTGFVSEINSSADRYTGTYEIEIAVKDNKNLLKSGFIGKTTIQSNVKNEYLQIPIEALISADKMIGKVNVLFNGKKQLKTIKIAQILGEQLLISEGLSVTEELILN